MLRNIKGTSWAWQEKKILELIENSFSGREVISARSVYLALTELASNYKSQTFSEYKIAISAKSHVGINTLTKILKQFKAIGIIEKTQQKASNGKWGKLYLEMHTPFKTKCATVFARSTTDRAPSHTFRTETTPFLNKNKINKGNINFSEGSKEQLLRDRYKNEKPSTPYARMAMRIMLEGKGLINKLNPYEAKK